MTQTPTQHNLGLALPVREAIGFRGSFELAQEAERLGYRSLWTAEVSGLDAFTVLAAYATVTTRVQLGTAVIAIQTRTPVMMAMSFASLHVLSGGRAVIGLGVGSPVIAERWHGVPYPESSQVAQARVGEGPRRAQRPMSTRARSSSRVRRSSRSVPVR